MCILIDEETKARKVDLSKLQITVQTTISKNIEAKTDQYPVHEEHIHNLIPQVHCEVNYNKA